MSSRRVAASIAVLVLLIFSKYFYVASITSYYSFYLIEKFHVSVRSAQIHLFVFLLAMALGTLFGGPLGDRIGRKRVILVSILGIAPFTLILPYVDLIWVGMLTFVIGLILSSAFSAIVVFAQELMPGNVGAVSGLFFGFASASAASARLKAALRTGMALNSLFICAYLPLLGMVAHFCLTERRKSDPGTTAALSQYGPTAPQRPAESPGFLSRRFRPHRCALAQATFPARCLRALPVDRRLWLVSAGQLLRDAGLDAVPDF